MKRAVPEWISRWNFPWKYKSLTPLSAFIHGFPIDNFQPIIRQLKPEARYPSKENVICPSSV